jgi:choline dehydrogenase-like flavoprotein
MDSSAGRVTPRASVTGSGGLDRRFDAIVIGSGPGGSIAVRELTERGLDVLLLEAGRPLTDEDFVPVPHGKPTPTGFDLVGRATAMARGQYLQARRAFFSPSTSRFLVNDWDNPYTTPRGAPYLWIRGRVLGGRLNSYGRVLQRMSDLDFRAASGDGNGIDWPVAYADLEPWYDRVEEFLGVYGTADGLAHPPDGRYVGEARLTAVEQDFKQKVEARWPDRHVIPWRYAAPNPGRVPLGIAAAQATGRLTVRTDAVVTRITVDDRTGLASGAIFVDRLSRREQRVYADAVVVCASTIETVRLLLNSGSSRHPDGLANSSGLVGRYFMDQTISLAFCDAPQFPGYSAQPDETPDDPFYGRTGGILIPRFDNLDGGSSAPFARGISFQGLGGRIPVPEGTPASFGIGGVGEMLPMYDNRISLSGMRRDRWGVPAAHVRCAIGDNDRLLLRRQVKALREMVGEAGYQPNFVVSVLGLDSRKVWPAANPLQRLVFRIGIRMSIQMGSAIHECGGARMGDDPRTSVVNGVNQAWDVPNLFIPDGASFTSNSTVGPALTIMALAARTSAYIAELHTRGELGRPAESGPSPAV